MAIRLEDHKRMEYLDGLIVSIQGGDRDALGTLYHETSAGVYSFALSILKNVHDAQDVLQDCYISVFQSANQYRSGTKPMAWIMTIARNLCMMRLRQQSRTGEFPTEDWQQPTDSYSEEDTVDKIVLQQCMSRLNDDERQILVLHAVAGFKHREIAELMDLALPTVLSKYHRALQKLRNHI